jgi:hypothetical protein
VDDRLPEYLEPIFNDACRNMTKEQSLKFKDFLLSRVVAFADPSKPVERYTIGEHRIKLKGEVPVKEPVRRVPIMDEELRKLEEQGMIERSYSPWSSSLVLVQKKDKSWRLCVDYRRLYADTIKDAYPITYLEWQMILTLSLDLHGFRHLI